MMLFFIAALATAQDDVAAGWGDLSDLPRTEEAPIHDVRQYGFVDSYFEAVAPVPSVNGSPKGELEYGFDLPNVNIMLQGSIYEKYRYFLNLSGPGSAGSEDTPVAIRNAWVEAPIIGSFLQVRAGKLYRRFGIYNEQLDAVPTFIGIEPPELFDKDHLMLTRTTNLMLFGSVSAFEGTTLNYAVTTGNDERAGNAVPLGADVNLTHPRWRIGSSFYWTGGDAAPGNKGGVENWMISDRYYVLGGYAEATPGNWRFQGAYWHARHDAERDPDAVAGLVDAGLNGAQADRFFVDGDPALGTNTAGVQYSVQTAYIRTARDFAVGDNAALTPYAQVDWFRNPETVADKSVGGDNEAGLSDDGQFFKYTVGTIFRPVPQIALKIDGSAHHMLLHDTQVFYPEVRVSFSYLWDAGL